MFRLIRAAFFGILFAIGLGLLGAGGGFLLGFGISTFDEAILPRGNPQGPLLFLLTGPLSALADFFYGLYKGYTYRAGSDSDHTPVSDE